MLGTPHFDISGAVARLWDNWVYRIEMPNETRELRGYNSRAAAFDAMLRAVRAFALHPVNAPVRMLPEGEVCIWQDAEVVYGSVLVCSESQAMYSCRAYTSIQDAEDDAPEHLRTACEWVKCIYFD